MAWRSLSAMTPLVSGVAVGCGLMSLPSMAGRVKFVDGGLLGRALLFSEDTEQMENFG